MRQIHICARLLVVSWTCVSCSGEAFTWSGSGGSSNENAAASSAGGSGSVKTVTGSRNPDLDDKTTYGGVSSSGGSQSSSGGSSPSGAGSAGSSNGATAPETCSDGAITFRMLPDLRLGSNRLCDAGCGTGWLTITDAEGATAFSLFAACGTASCESCEVLPCATAACVPTVLTPEGTELVWTGTYMAKSTCGASMTCQRPTCAQPGKYKARACAAVNAGSTGAGCVPKNEQRCAEADFQFPGTGTVKLVIK